MAIRTQMIFGEFNERDAKKRVDCPVCGKHTLDVFVDGWGGPCYHASCGVKVVDKALRKVWLLENKSTKNESVEDDEVVAVDRWVSPKPIEMPTTVPLTEKALKWLKTIPKRCPSIDYSVYGIKSIINEYGREGVVVPYRHNHSSLTTVPEPIYYYTRWIDDGTTVQEKYGKCSYPKRGVESSTGKPLWISPSFYSTKPTIIVEGQFSAMALHQLMEGTVNTIAVGGSKWSIDNKLWVSNYLKKSTTFIMLDKDLLSEALEEETKGLGVKSYMIPNVIDGKDPEELINEIGNIGLKVYLNKWIIPVDRLAANERNEAEKKEAYDNLLWCRDFVRKEYGEGSDEDSFWSNRTIHQGYDFG